METGDRRSWAGGHMPKTWPSLLAAPTRIGLAVLQSTFVLYGVNSKGADVVKQPSLSAVSFFGRGVRKLRTMYFYLFLFDTKDAISLL